MGRRIARDASTDCLTGGIDIHALAEQKLTGKVLVSRQDADLAACQRVAAADRSMTVYKPIKKLAGKAAEVALLLARKQAVSEATRMLPDAKSLDDYAPSIW